MASHKHLDRMPEMRREWPAPVLSPWRWFGDLFEDGAGSQLISVKEFAEDDTLVIKAELPGIDPETDVEISVSDGVLQIRAERIEADRHKGRQFHHRELRYGAFVRQLSLPEGADEEKIAANYKDGILEVRVPVPGEPSVEPAHRVPVARA